MGSKSYSSSYAADNRVAATDSGIALGTGGGSGNSFNVAVTDGGAFAFAENALNSMLSSIIDGQKIQQKAADTIAGAVQQSAQTQAIAAAASQAAAAEATKTSSNWIEANKRILIVAALVGVGYFVWKGRK